MAAVTHEAPVPAPPEYVKVDRLSSDETKGLIPLLPGELEGRLLDEDTAPHPVEFQSDTTPDDFNPRRRPRLGAYLRAISLIHGTTFDGAVGMYRQTLANCGVSAELLGPDISITEVSGRSYGIDDSKENREYRDWILGRGQNVFVFTCFGASPWFRNKSQKPYYGFVNPFKYYPRPDEMPSTHKRHLLNIPSDHDPKLTAVQSFYLWKRGEWEARGIPEAEQDRYITEYESDPDRTYAEMMEAVTDTGTNHGRFIGEKWLPKDQGPDPRKFVAQKNLEGATRYLDEIFLPLARRQGITLVFMPSNFDEHQTHAVIEGVAHPMLEPMKELMRRVEDLRREGVDVKLIMLADFYERNDGRWQRSHNRW